MDLSRDQNKLRDGAKWEPQKKGRGKAKEKREGSEEKEREKA